MLNWSSDLVLSLDPGRSPDDKYPPATYPESISMQVTMTDGGDIYPGVTILQSRRVRANAVCARSPPPSLSRPEGGKRLRAQGVGGEGPHL